MELTQEQMLRLYMVFDFEDYEEIVNATIESDKGGYMEINYIDNQDNANGCYKPYFEKHSQEDREKLNFILNGVELVRS